MRKKILHILESLNPLNQQRAKLVFPSFIDSSHFLTIFHQNRKGNNENAYGFLHYKTIHYFAS